MKIVIATIIQCNGRHQKDMIRWYFEFRYVLIDKIPQRAARHLEKKLIDICMIEVRFLFFSIWQIEAFSDWMATTCQTNGVSK